MPTDPATPRRRRRTPPGPDRQRLAVSLPNTQTIKGFEQGSPEGVTSIDADVVSLADARAQRAADPPGPTEIGPDLAATGRARSGRMPARERRSRGRGGRIGARPAPDGPQSGTGPADPVDWPSSDRDSAERAATIARIVAAMGRLTPEERHRLALLLPPPARRRAA
jgi:hypothetical protein